MSDTSEVGSHNVFISYSRVDGDNVSRLQGALDTRGRRSWVDWKDIAPTAEWMGEIRSARSVNESTLRGIPLLEPLGEEELAAVLATAYERTVMADESIVEQWETSREFYVLLEGAVDVLIEGERRDRMERGDFFGELAALDWGADFAYPRLAKVVAASDCRLLVLPAAVLNRLVRGSSAVSQLINDAVRRRLPGL